MSQKLRENEPKRNCQDNSVTMWSNIRHGKTLERFAEIKREKLQLLLDTQKGTDKKFW